MRKVAMLIGVLVWFVCASPSYADSSHNPIAPVPGGTVNTSPPGIQTGADQATMTDILDIKANKAIGFDYTIIYIFLGVVAAIILLGLIFLLIDRYLKRRKSPAIRIEPPVPADVSALKGLDELERGGFYDARIFYFTLTAIVKTYLDGRFNIDAPEMTTEELLPKINDLSIEKSLAMDVKELLKRSDPVKFAGMTEKQEQMARDISFVKSFVTRTTPVELPTEPSGNP